MKLANSARGFSLIEVMIALVIIISVLGAGVAWLASERSRVARGDAITTQAIEMATIGRALDQYLRSAASLPPDGSVVEISAADLTAALLIPENYGIRDQFGDYPSTPLGQRYVMVGRNTAGQARGLVLAVGEPDPAALNQAGIKATTEAIEDVQAAVVRQMRNQQYVASALVRALSSVADRSVSTFDFDFSPYLGDPVVQPTAIALVGFPEFSAAPDIRVSIDPDSLAGIGGGGAGGAARKDYTGWSCHVPAVNTDCPSDAEEVARYDICGKWGSANAGMPLAETIQLGNGWGISVTRSRQTRSNSVGLHPNVQADKYLVLSPHSGEYMDTVVSRTEKSVSGMICQGMAMYWSIEEVISRKYNSEQLPDFEFTRVTAKQNRTSSATYWCRETPASPNIFSLNRGMMLRPENIAAVATTGAALTTMEVEALRDNPTYSWGELHKVGEIQQCDAPHAVPTPVYERIGTYGANGHARLLMVGTDISPNQHSYFQEEWFQESVTWQGINHGTSSAICEESLLSQDTVVNFPRSAAASRACPSLALPGARAVGGGSYPNRMQLYRYRSPPRVVKLCCRNPM
ncbi:prepilin-type N-terminal cleavage/methylation domain-containing protein [Luteimonas sp. MHLX1A]|uniref:prepilin-type N-terminal cleavage/methylation domain-containing protein n=1 Tax=Alterluteimonas muca TaxID=2878684 RepID=UPI001E600AE1|nr:type II secretion system GspH family protein [Luteimonas sp. MHLX1A]